MWFEVHRNHLESQAPFKHSVRLRLPSMTHGQTARWVNDLAPPFRSAPFEWKIGVHPLDLDSWLVIDPDLDSDRSEKAELLRTRHGDVVAVMPGSEPAAGEVLGLVTAHLRDRDIPIPVDGVPAHPIERAARLVSEDLVVMERDVIERDTAAWRLTAACVCFPTRWDLASKRGRSMAEIHAPVPRYARDLEQRTDTFFDRLRVERPVWRSNWTIDADWSNRLEPDERVPRDPSITAENVGSKLCLRVEYQTLRRLPNHDAILFTIRILRRPLSWVLDNGEGGGLAAALDAMPADVADYKAGSVRYHPEMTEWLRRSGVS